MELSNRMTLKIGAIAYSEWQALMPLMECYGWDRSKSGDIEDWFHDKVETIKPTMHQSTENYFVLLHSRPELALVRAMANGKSPEKAFREWSLSAELLLDFYKHNRRICVLLEVSNVLANPKACMELFQGHFDLTTDKLLPELPNCDLGSTLEQLLAHQLVSQSDGQASLLAEIEACTFPLSETAFSVPAIDIKGIYALLCSEPAQKNNAYSALERKAEEALAQVYPLQEEAERLHVKYKKKEEEAIDLQVRVEIRNQKLEKSNALVDATSNVKTLLEELVDFPGTEWSIKNKTQISHLKADIESKTQILKKISSTTEFYFYTNNNHCLASPFSDDVILDVGMLPEACAGEFLQGKEDLTVEQFSKNPTFVKFLHWVISKHIPQYPGLSVVAEQKLSGESQVPDLRGLADTGELSGEDTIGIVEFKDGKIISFEANESYSPFTEKGFMQLDPWFHEKYMEELTEYVNEQAAKTEQAHNA